jgi:hypothetical protein
VIIRLFIELGLDGVEQVTIENGGLLSMLIERLDQHRGRGQQQITVKHVTVNADQAVVADQVVSGRSNEASTTALLTSGTDKPIRLIEPVQSETVWVEGGGSQEK